jgi:hypothetical protein
MKKITEKISNAFNNNINFCESNTCVSMNGDGEMELRLFGNLIASKTKKGIVISDGGYPLSNTTKDRLNALTNVFVNTRVGVHFLNGVQWNGNKTLIVDKLKWEYLINSHIML